MASAPCFPLPPLSVRSSSFAFGGAWAAKSLCIKRIGIRVRHMGYALWYYVSVVAVTRSDVSIGHILNR